jgi:hypothetical protein
MAWEKRRSWLEQRGIRIAGPLRARDRIMRNVVAVYAGPGPLYWVLLECGHKALWAPDATKGRSFSCGRCLDAFRKERGT